jgi:4-hydroxybenzoate polyprenyltransferase
VLGFYLVSAALALAAWAAAGLGPLFLAVFAVYGLHLARQARNLRLDEPALALRIFKSNREAGLLLTVALIAGLWRPF